MASVLYIYVVAAVCITASAFPSGPQRMYSQHAQEQLNPLNYYLDSQDHYYGSEQKQGVNHSPNSSPARLETLEPDSEVELVPGVQPPQQPPQQPPVAPNLPGLALGQRVYIVHMPIPGYRPGTISGYQPVYIVAAAPQGNAGFPGNGFQNAVLLDPSGQAVSPVLGYQKSAVLAPQHNPGLILGSPLALSRPLELGYQDYAGQAPLLQAVDGIRGLQLAQQIGLQGPVAHGHGAPVAMNNPNAESSNHNAGESEALNASQGIKEAENQKSKPRTASLPRKA